MFGEGLREHPVFRELLEETLSPLVVHGVAGALDQML